MNILVYSKSYIITEDKRKRIIKHLVFIMIALLFLSVPSFSIVLRYKLHMGDSWSEIQKITLDMEFSGISKRSHAEVVGLATYNIDAVKDDGTINISITREIISSALFVDGRQVSEKPNPGGPFHFNISRTGKLINKGQYISVTEYGNAEGVLPIEYPEKDVNVGEIWPLDTMNFIDQGFPSSSIKRATGRILAVRRNLADDRLQAEVELIKDIDWVIPRGRTNKEVVLRIYSRIIRFVDTDSGIPLAGNVFLDINIPQKSDSDFRQMKMKSIILIEPSSIRR